MASHPLLLEQSHRQNHPGAKRFLDDDCCAPRVCCERSDLRITRSSVALDELERMRAELRACTSADLEDRSAARLKELLLRMKSEIGRG